MATPTAVAGSGIDTTDGAVGWQRALTLAPPLLLLGLSALVIRRFHLETRTFYQVFLLATAAFPIHALLPLRYRLPFFTVLSLAGIVLVFGLGDGAMLVGAGVLLIGACHLPTSFPVRIGVLLALGVTLALARAGVAPSPIPEVVWPILGSMFMFRLALYLHALKHDQQKPTIARTLSYFFMLPNVCYPLYPVVDYSTFGRSHYDAPAGEIYARGVKWITRGLLHLLLYRFVYLRLTLGTTDITSLGTLVQSLLAVFFLYLRISGQFHLIVGILHLFGFRLPETHRLYFLASSITDYWRRINIYWKDFMMKLMFYPSFFRLRKRGDRIALVGATMLVFLATWALHSYQWFWLRAEFPVTAQDLLFWGLLGGLVVVNSLRESRRGRTRTLGAHGRGWNARLAFQTMGTFVLLCVLWSLWSTDSIVDWLWMWPAAANVSGGDVLLLAGLVAFGLAVGGVVWDAPVAETKGPIPLWRRPTVQSGALLVSLLVVGSPRVRDGAGPTLAAALRSLQSTALNSRDAAIQHRGYYENLDDRGRLSAQVWGVVQQRPRDWQVLAQTDAYVRKDHDFLRSELRPLTQVRLSGEVATINRWGMRDRDYSLEKPAGTRRIALLGPSHVMGMGVTDDETFDALLEARLNLQADTARRYEVLNFGVAAYSLTQQLRLLDERVFAFAPDVIIVTDTRNAANTIVGHLTSVLAAGIDIPYPELVDIVRSAGVPAFDRGDRGVPTAALRRAARFLGIDARPPWREVELRLTRVSGELLAWSFRHIGERARANRAVPVYLAMGNVLEPPRTDNPMEPVARDAGLLVFDLYDLYEGQPREALRIAPWDDHPNARATRMIADRLYTELQRHEAELGLGLDAGSRDASPATPNPGSP